MEEPEVLQPMGLQRVGHDLVTEQQQQQYSMYYVPDYIASSLHIEVIYSSRTVYEVSTTEPPFYR